MLRTANGLLDLLVKACAIAACFSLAFMTVAITIEVILRSFFRATMQFTDEYSGYMVLAVAALGVAYARERNSLLTVDFLVNRLTPVLRARIDFVYGLVSLAFCLLLTGYIVNFWLATIRRGLTAATMQHTPLWIPQMLLPIGFILLCLVVARKLFRPDQPVPSEVERVLEETTLGDMR